MILFVFEGGKREPRLYEAIHTIFMPKDVESIVCAYRCNIYKLYSQLREYDVFGDSDSVDTVSIINELLKANHDNTLSGIRPSEVSEIYLFFDYDFHHHSIEDLQHDNAHIAELLRFFNDETGNGKLYINYPMVESIRYTRQLPDADYHSYTITRQECKETDFKFLATEFSVYKSLDHLLLSNNPKEAPSKQLAKFEQAKSNWLHLIGMNVAKANHLCHGSHSMPTAKSLIAQPLIFDAQLHKHVNTERCGVAILNAFPIFLFDYLKELPQN